MNKKTLINIIREFGDGTAQKNNNEIVGRDLNTFDKIIHYFKHLGFKPALNDKGNYVELHGHTVFKDSHGTRLYYNKSTGRYVDVMKVRKASSHGEEEE
jgi:hypothetical protein